jgi:hypothetical protein
MANEKDTKIEGEGSYSGSRDYNERTKDFIKRKGSQIESLAEDAEDALDGPEGDELKHAENKGKSRAKH